MSQLSPDLRAAAIAYRESQLRTIAATDAKYKAEAAWRDAHQDELNALGDERAKAHTLARAARERVDIARSAQAHYERDQVRAAQTSAAPRAPRNTPATAYNAMSPEASAAIVGAHMTSKLVDGKYRRVPADVNGNAVVIAPNFKATVKDGATFKKNMTAMFPGIIVEGLPRKANAHVLTQIHDEFSALRDEFPEVAVRHVKLNASGSRGVAYAAGDKITIGRNVVESFELAHIGFASGQLREEPRDQPDFHDGTRNGPAYLVRHEFAHQLDFQYPEIRQYFDAEMAKHSGEVNARISVYANKDRWERFAETFAFQKYGDKGTKAHPAMSAMERAIAQWKAKRKVTP